jgi:hypothetical protein
MEICEIFQKSTSYLDFNVLNYGFILWLTSIVLGILKFLFFFFYEGHIWLTHHKRN